jgi:hypothetical protein
VDDFEVSAEDRFCTLESVFLVTYRYVRMDIVLNNSDTTNKKNNMGLSGK